MHHTILFTKKEWRGGGVDDDDDIMKLETIESKSARLNENINTKQ